MGRFLTFCAVALVCVGVLVCGCISGGEPPPQPTLPPNEIAVDGIVTLDEYSGSARVDERMTVYWRVDGDIITMAVVARTEGMVAVGFGATVGMRDADMVIGWASDTGMAFFDAYSTGTTGPHPPDEELGGTYDLIEANATEQDGYTTLEFSRALVTGDPYDAELPASGELRLIWALGKDDDFSAQHVARGAATLLME